MARMIMHTNIKESCQSLSYLGIMMSESRGNLRMFLLNGIQKECFNEAAQARLGDAACPKKAYKTAVWGPCAIRKK